jgi:S1-C subfamily serine protease
MKRSIWGLWLAIVLIWGTLQLPSRAEPVVMTQVTASPAQVSRVDQFLGSGASIQVARIRSGLLPGAVIGGHHEGFLKMVYERYTASGGLSEQLEEATRHLLEDELSEAGYNVLRSEQDSVFDEPLAEDLEPGRFLVGGTITQTNLNSYSSWFQDVTKVEQTIRWEVLDRDLGKVVFRQETQGQAEAEGINNPAASYEAIRASFQVFLDEPKFQRLMKQPIAAKANLSSESKAYEIAAIASSSQPLPTEKLVGRAIPSIVQIRTPTGRGTGFLLNSPGLLLTNQHVVGSALSVKVDLYDGSTYTGRVLRRDANLDAALLKLEGGTPEVSGLPLCHTNAVRVGELVVAIGNPLALSNTVTQGIVSGFRRSHSRQMIQTDTAVNPGNSGGPLLNQHGTVIGIVTQKITTEGVEGLGFALPISDVLQKLKVNVVTTPSTAKVDSCGNPIVA